MRLYADLTKWQQKDAVDDDEYVSGVFFLNSEVWFSQVSKGKHENEPQKVRILTCLPHI